MGSSPKEQFVIRNKLIKILLHKVRDFVRTWLYEDLLFSEADMGEERQFI